MEFDNNFNYHKHSSSNRSNFRCLPPPSFLRNRGLAREQRKTFVSADCKLGVWNHLFVAGGSWKPGLKFQYRLQ